MLKNFLRYPDIGVYPEPVDVWTNLNGTDFLGLVYQDQARWGMTFESLVQLTMVETHVADKLGRGNGAPPLKIMERSVHSARYCFVETMSGVIEPVESLILDQWYHLLVERPEFDLDLDLIVYLRTEPEVVFGRMNGRGREEEAGVPLEYLQNLHRLHEDWLVNRNSTMEQQLPRVIIIDATEDISTLQHVYRDLAKAIWRAIPKQLRGKQL